MAVRRPDVVAALAVHDPAVLRAILEAAHVSPRSADTPPELAARIADALWWNYCTPAGYLAERATLDDIVDHVSRRLKLELVASGAWARVRELTVEIARQTASQIDVSDPSGGVAYSSLDERVQQRLEPSWMPVALGATGGAGSLTAGMVGRVVVRIGATPIGRLLPFVPYVGPVWKGVRTVGGVAAFVGTPLAIGLSAVALNESLGANYRKLVPLLLGVGALGPTAVEEAWEV